MENFSENSYAGFSEIDFINDPILQEWIIRPDEKSDQNWSSFLKAHPEKRQDVENAVRFLRALQFEPHEPDIKRIKECYDEHMSQVKASKPTKPIKMRNTRRPMYLYAAALLAAVVLFASLLYTFDRNSTAQIAVLTNYGEIKQVSLPDGSSVVLNAHSQVKYSATWNDEETREVWLTGEAFFNVKHLTDTRKTGSSQKKFLVHGEGFTIEVVGTSFDIRQRRGKTEVVLQTGKIILVRQQNPGQKIEMEPGDMLTYDIKDATIIRARTRPEEYSGWKEKKLFLNNPTLKEIVVYLEDNYGKNIVLESPEIGNKRIEGPIQLNNLDDALFIISTVLNTDIERKDSVILIRAK